MKRQHKHAALIQQWLDDDSLIVERKAGDGNWYKQTDCFWNEESEYRFKPKMIRCGDLEFPEPMRPELPHHAGMNANGDRLYLAVQMREYGKLVESATREECAKQVEQDLYPDDSGKPYTQQYNYSIKVLAEKIRSGT